MVLSMRERKKMERTRARAREEAEACKPEPGSAEDIVRDNEVTDRWLRVSNSASD